MTDWDAMTERICEILADAAVGSTEHHFGGTYMTAHQLAIELKARLGDDLPREIGGEGAGPGSVAAYISNQLSRRILADPGRYPIEGAFLSAKDTQSLVFRGPQGGIEPTTAKSGRGMSIYRLRQA